MTEQAVISFRTGQVTDLKRAATQGRSYADRLSIVFAVELLERFYDRKDYWPILDELDGLEHSTRASRTKKEEQFLDPPLYPLWHKHFFAPRHLLKNIGVRWSLDRKGNDDLMSSIQAIAKNNGDFPDQWPRALTDRIVIGGLEDRHGRLTGDWIIFGKHKHQNYYLGTAMHEEGKDAAALLARLRKNCRVEFPFCFAD
jgi:hypothetical protein